MGCDLMQFRNECISYEKESNADLIRQQNFWSEKTSELGDAFAEILGVDKGLTWFCPYGFVELFK